MSDLCFVSSLNLPYFNLCGRDFISSFLEYVDPSIWLQLWCDSSIEGKLLDEYALPANSEGRIVKYDLGQADGIESFLSFVDRKSVPKSSVDPLERLSVGSGYDYRKDLRTFGLKGMALSEALSCDHPRYVFWVDADTVFQRPLRKVFLKELFEDNSIIYFGRDSPHSETGFIGIDKLGKGVEEFKEEYRNCWTKGLVFKLSAWTDSHVFDRALEVGKKAGLQAKSLSRQPRGHVIPTSVLGPYLDHRKGPRKLRGGTNG